MGLTAQVSALQFTLDYAITLILALLGDILIWEWVFADLYDIVTPSVELANRSSLR